MIKYSSYTRIIVLYNIFKYIDTLSESDNHSYLLLKYCIHCGYLYKRSYIDDYDIIHDYLFDKFGDLYEKKI